MVVMKFGGTSLADAEAIAKVAVMVGDRLHEKPVVVVSALAGVTDSLVMMSRLAATGSLADSLKLLRQVRERHFAVLFSLVDERQARAVHTNLQSLFDGLQEVLRGVAALGELSPRTTDNVLSCGEVLSSCMVTAAFLARGVSGVLVDSRQCLVTDASHTRAIPNFEATNDRLRHRVNPLLRKNKVPVMAGFIAATPEGVPTTLGRGGSDFSAAIVGAALHARRIEIWTDVDGMMTTDPRLCSQARRIDVIGFEEASELAYFGAKVLHPATLIPAVQENIPVYILNSRDPLSQGTCIRARAPRSHTVFRALAVKQGVKIINVRSPRMLMAYGFLRALFEVFERHAISADLVSTSEVSVSVAVDSIGDVNPLVADLKRLGSVELENGKAIVCLVGENIKGRSGVAASVFQAVAAGRINLHMISQGASEINISFVVEEADVPDVVARLHDRFFAVQKPARNGKTGKSTMEPPDIVHPTGAGALAGPLEVAQSSGEAKS